MKRTNFFKVSIIFFVLISLISCKKDDNDTEQIDITTDVIGEWQRSDSTDEVKFKLFFEDDNFGYINARTEFPDGSVTSSALPFNWTTNNNVVTIDNDVEITTFNFSINTEGQYFLRDETELFYVKL